MIREYVVKITDEVQKNAFQRFENEYSPEQEIIRCEKCIYSEPERIPGEIWCRVTSGLRDVNWFCADGQRSNANECS